MAAVPGVERRANLGTHLRVERRMLFGILLVALSVVGGLLLWRNATSTTSVVVAASAIPPGHVLQRRDLELARVHLDDDLQRLAFTEGDLAAMTGKVAGTTIHAGEMVVRPDLSTGTVLGPDEAAVTIPVDGEHIYAGIRPTDAVAVIATKDAGKPESETAPLIDRAVVLATTAERTTLHSTATDTAADAGELTAITLVIPRSDMARVADAINNDQLTVVLLSRGAEGG